MVFQNYALYPHMSVAENMSFGLKLKGFAKDEIGRRVAEAARILDIGDLLDRLPKQLSGGQRQRVAMGRAIVRDPKVFLFDEPLSNLDAKLRVQMRIEIKKVHQKVRTTTVYVTHDQVEAMTLADRVVVMNQGRIEQVGAPNELYHNPATRFVAGFIGSPAMNFLPCRLEEAAGALRARLTDKLSFPVPAARTQRYRPHAGKKLLFGLRGAARGHRTDGDGDAGLFRRRRRRGVRPRRPVERRRGGADDAPHRPPPTHAPDRRRVGRGSLTGRADSTARRRRANIRVHSSSGESWRKAIARSRG
jgi:ABC-type sugar transport system ATPase subunit